MEHSGMDSGSTWIANTSARNLCQIDEFTNETPNAFIIE